jgi:hypothetical protein
VRNPNSHPSRNRRLDGLAIRRKKIVAPYIEEAAGHFLAEIARIAATAWPIIPAASGATRSSTILAFTCPF